MLNTTVSREVSNELIELIEDTVEYFCDEHKMSGEVVYTMVQCIAEAKVREFVS